jgi:glucosylceramidase
MPNHKAKTLRWVSTTAAQPWRKRTLDFGGHDPIAQQSGSCPPKSRRENDFGESCPAKLELSGERDQTWEGFGGCFNELGFLALNHLDKAGRAKIFKELFSAEGCRFNICRLPIGASDYAAEWYCHNETPGDYAMKHFSIERDRKYLIPYIKSALQVRKDIKFFASPWSPPPWMKFPKACNFGRMIWEKRNLESYALYFVKFAEAYRREGIPISQIHVQNEPSADQKFPSCVWSGQQLTDFIRDYMGPAFKKHRCPAEIWFGTINHGGFNSFGNVVLSDERARAFLSGIGYQWTGKEALQQTHTSYPDLRIYQTENECGDGENTWEYAAYIFGLFRHYLTNGVNAYIYWNMVLEPEGRSTWGWKQNSMITVDPKTRKAIFNPEFYIMKHFSRFIDPGAVRLGLRGPHTGNAVAFANPSGAIVLVVNNPLSQPKPLRFSCFNGSFKVDLEPQSYHTFVLG